MQPFARLIRHLGKTGRRLRLWLVALSLVALGVVIWAYSRPALEATTAGGSDATATVRRTSFVHTLRATGTVEAIRSFTVIAPRMAGQQNNSLVITRLVGAGARVHAGDVLIEFDRQDQIRTAQDRRAEYQDFEQQIRKKVAEQAAARAHDDTELKQAENDVGRARLEVQKNDLLPRIQAEKNTLALEQAQAKLRQLQHTFSLKRKAAEADLRILEIRRDRSMRAMQHAERNAERMTITVPFDGLAVIRSVWKGSQMAEVQEGEEIRPGMPIVDVVDPNAMRIRAKINQADINLVAIGQQARIQLDAYPDLSFDGRIEQLAPLGVSSTMTPKVRTFVAVVSIKGSHPNLMPDLSAAVDIIVERRDRVLVAPRDAVWRDNEGTWVRVRRGAAFQRQTIKIGSASNHEVVVESGLDEGTVVARQTAGGGN